VSRSENKAALRPAAATRREAAHDPAAERAANAALAALLRAHAPAALAGYMPIRSEISPLPAMEALAGQTRLCLPVVVGKGRPLSFRAWAPGEALVEGAYGARVPAADQPVTPGALIVPLLAFDRAGTRLGYGGGFYDRTLEALRAAGPVLAVGLAFTAQEVPAVPRAATDQPLDAVVTEAGVIRPGA